MQFIQHMFLAIILIMEDVDNRYMLAVTSKYVAIMNGLKIILIFPDRFL